MKKSLLYFKASIMLFMPDALNAFWESANVKLSIRGGFSMKETMKNKVIKRGLGVLEKIAEKKANSECFGIIYEPKVPKKLKKTLCLVLACVFTMVTLFGGSVSKFYAAEHLNVEWQTSMYSPINSTYTDLVSLYITDETYQWGVTSYNIPNSFGKVRLDGSNCSVTTINGGQTLTTIGTRDFTIEIDTTAGYKFAQFLITMSYDSYPTWFEGYVKIK